MIYFGRLMEYQVNTSSDDVYPRAGSFQKEEP